MALKTSKGRDTLMYTKMGIVVVAGMSAHGLMWAMFAQVQSNYRLYLCYCNVPKMLPAYANNGTRKGLGGTEPVRA